MATLTSIINNIIQKVNNLTSSKVNKVTSTDNAIVRYNGTTGEVQNSGVIVDDNDNIGVGATPSNDWRNTQKVVEFPGGNAISNFNGLANITMSSNMYINSSGQIIYKNNGYASYYSQSDSIHSWYTAPSGTAGSPITWTTAMILGANGNLLVGTTTDNGVDKLQVNGSISSGTIQVIYNGDLNDYKTRTQVLGTYPSAYVSNIPINDNGYLEVIVYSPNAYVMQRFTTLGAIQLSPGRIFVRCLIGGVWSAWVEK